MIYFSHSSFKDFQNFQVVSRYPLKIGQRQCNFPTWTRLKIPNYKITRYNSYIFILPPSKDFHAYRLKIGQKATLEFSTRIFHHIWRDLTRFHVFTMWNVNPPLYPSFISSCTVGLDPVFRRTRRNERNRAAVHFALRRYVERGTLGLSHSGPTWPSLTPWTA